MLNELIRPRQRPVTNVVAVFVIAVTLLPILAAYDLTRDTSAGAGSGEVERVDPRKRMISHDGT